MEQEELMRDEFFGRLNSLSSKKLAQDANVSSSIKDEMENSTDTFRWLRNNSPRLHESTKTKLVESGLIDTCLWFFNHRFVYKPLSRSILLQFLANFSINHKTAQGKVFEGFHSILRNLIISSDDTKLCLHNDSYRLEVLNDHNIIQQIMTHWTEWEIEYSKIFLDSIFSNSKDFLIVYNSLPDSSKNQLMDLLSIWLECYKDDVSVEVIVAIIDNFFIDYTFEQISSKVINVLAKASNIGKFNCGILKHTILLEKIMDLFTFIHEHSKNSDDSDNEFKPVKNLSTLFINSDIQTDKRYWFKSDIIRLIASMCYNNQAHQNLMRTKNIIPMLLECCSFDAKNPLMREWSLFALRNILEGNLDNQNFVANIDSVGTIDPADSSIMLTDTLKMATMNITIPNEDVMFI